MGEEIVFNIQEMGQKEILGIFHAKKSCKNFCFVGCIFRVSTGFVSGNVSGYICGKG